MANSLPIHSLSLEAVQDVIRRALSAGLDADAIDDFLAEVDWSGAERELPAIASLLGELEGWSVQHSEGELTDSEYMERLQAVLTPLAPRRPRSRAVVSKPLT